MKRFFQILPLLLCYVAIGQNVVISGKIKNPQARRWGCNPIAKKKLRFLATP